jgi:uncharacterized membrane protein
MFILKLIYMEKYNWRKQITLWGSIASIVSIISIIIWLIILPNNTQVFLYENKHNISYHDSNKIEKNYR